MPARLPRGRRLTRASDVRRCLASGRRWRGGSLEVQGSQPAWDLVIRARRESYAASFAALRADLLEWRRAAG